MAGALMRNACGLALAVLMRAAAAADSLPDPTQPPALATPATTATAGGSAPAAPAFAVQSILFSPHRRLALVNGQEVHEGSQLGGARVVAIARGAVTLEVSGQRQTIQIHPDVNHDFALNPAAPASSGPKATTP